MNAVDTNVLIYVSDPQDPAKQAIATDLLLSLDDGILLWQVATEYLAASRKLKRFGYDSAQAWEDLQELQRLWRLVLPTWDVMEKSRKLLEQYMLSHWDAMIISASLIAGVERLYTEDFDAYPLIENLQIINPFST